MGSYLELNQQAGRQWLNKRSNESNILSVLYGLFYNKLYNIFIIKQTKNRHKYLLILSEKECFGMLI